MSKLKRSEYVRLMRDTYFSAVVREDYDAVMACFTKDGHVTIYHGDNPIQRFYKTPKRGQQSFSTFYGHLFENYHVQFGDYHFVVDVQERTCAATFVPKLRPKRNSAYLDTGRLQLNNCNFFWYRRGKIAEMIIYYANPRLGRKLGLAPKMPTAFPK